MGTFLENKVPQKSKLKKIIIKVGLLVQYSSKNLEFSTLINDFENQNFEIFEEVVLNFGKSDVDII